MSMRWESEQNQNLQLAALHQLDDVIEQDVAVPLTEAVDIVGHLDTQTGVVGLSRCQGAQRCAGVVAPSRRSGGR